MRSAPSSVPLPRPRDCRTRRLPDPGDITRQRIDPRRDGRQRRRLSPGRLVTGIGARASERRSAERINVEGTRNVLEVMRELEIPKGVYTSTLAVFGDNRRLGR